MADMVKELNTLLADYQVLYQKLRNYHWNITGENFFELHLKFEELYTGVAVTVDDIAERVRALGAKPLSTLKDQLAAARLKEDETVPDGRTMVANLLADYESLDGWLRTAAADADSAKDVPSRDLLEGIIGGEAKTMWMLRTFLGR
ncbi:MAG: DNA starvation/stationary phase protection protein [Candidatus Hydrogenedens sp.]|nr:DNA starvation/stationary phase protection protein [Candidatus Hydrogenedens sp.]